MPKEVMQFSQFTLINKLALDSTFLTMYRDAVWCMMRGDGKQSFHDKQAHASQNNCKASQPLMSHYHVNKLRGQEDICI